jgi:hypothetical protein
MDVVRPHLADVRRTRSAETLVSSSSHSTWPLSAILSAVSHSVWPVMAILGGASHPSGLWPEVAAAGGGKRWARLGVGMLGGGRDGWPITSRSGGPNSWCGGLGAAAWWRLGCRSARASPCSPGPGLPRPGEAGAFTKKPADDLGAPAGLPRSCVPIAGWCGGSAAGAREGTVGGR